VTLALASLASLILLYVNRPRRRLALLRYKESVWPIQSPLMGRYVGPRWAES
jgi:hypothetical protein